ncbi:MAG: hypothetical protein E6Y37_12570, partial [Enterobacter hormaechei]|nr:hypothetical protein [Enterobacter hormaechei]
MSEQINPLWNHFIRAVQEEVKPALGCTCLLYTSPSPRD